MNREAQERILEIRKDRRSQTFRNCLLIFTSSATLLMALVLWAVLSQVREETTVVVQEAQDTLKATCDLVDEKVLAVSDRKNCAAAQRNELPEVLQSVVDNPDPDDPERQDPEVQDSEQQDPESQDPEIQDSEGQETEIPDSEVNDPDPDDPEIQEEEIQEGELQEPEIQEDEEQNAPVCPTGYTQMEFHYFGANGADDEEGSPTDDDQDWLLCVRNK